MVACWQLLAAFASSDAVAAAPLFGELRDAVAASFAAAGGTLPAGWQSIWALPPGGDDSARLLAPVAVRVSGRKRSAPASYATRDENDELPEDAARTGPVLDWSWLPLPISPSASAPEWISFTLPCLRRSSRCPARCRWSPFSDCVLGAREEAKPTSHGCLPARAPGCPGSTPCTA